MLMELNIKLIKGKRKKYEWAKLFGMHPTRLSQILNEMYPATFEEESKIATVLGVEKKEIFPDSRNLVGVA